MGILPSSAAYRAARSALWQRNRAAFVWSAAYRSLGTGTSKKGRNDSKIQNDDIQTTTSSAAAATTTATDLTMSLFKNPIVQRLWSARQEAKQQPPATPASSLEDSLSRSSNTPSNSRVQVSYPFSTDPLLLETYQNPWGQVRLGKIFEDLDALAGNIAFFHVQKSLFAQENNDSSLSSFPVIVTASVDRIRLKRRPLMKCDQILSGQVTWTGRSSMEIKMCCAEVPDNSDHNGSNNGEDEWLEAYVTFVTLDPHTKRPMVVPPIVPKTPEEKKEFDDGEQRAVLKKQLRKHQKLHQNDQRVDGDDESVKAVESLARDLLEQAAPLLNLPSLANPHDILMEQTHMQNAMIAQPQVQNLHNRIFGGFLMRRAFELAFATVYCFAGAKPIFLEVDQVSFTRPVDVGDLLVFHSHVLYTDKGKVQDYYDQTLKQESQSSYQEDGKEHPLVHVEVEAWVTVPEEASSKVSNKFNFTFAIAPSVKKDGEHTSTTASAPAVRRILPGNIDQARRMATRMMADQEQRKLDQLTRRQ